MTIVEALSPLISGNKGFVVKRRSSTQVLLEYNPKDIDYRRCRTMYIPVGGWSFEIPINTVHDFFERNLKNLDTVISETLVYPLIFTHKCIETATGNSAFTFILSRARAMEKNSMYSRSFSYITSDGIKYYAAPGMLFDSEGHCLYYMTTKIELKEVPSHNGMSIGRAYYPTENILYINPIVYENTDSISKLIVQKLIPAFLETPQEVWIVSESVIPKHKVVVYDIDHTMFESMEKPVRIDNGGINRDAAKFAKALNDCTRIF